MFLERKENKRNYVLSALGTKVTREVYGKMKAEGKLYAWNYSFSLLSDDNKYNLPKIGSYTSEAREPAFVRFSASAFGIRIKVSNGTKKIKTVWAKNKDELEEALKEIEFHLSYKDKNTLKAMSLEAFERSRNIEWEKFARNVSYERYNVNISNHFYGGGTLYIEGRDILGEKVHFYAISAENAGFRNHSKKDYLVDQEALIFLKICGSLSSSMVYLGRGYFHTKEGRVSIFNSFSQGNKLCTLEGEVSISQSKDVEPEELKKLYIQTRKARGIKDSETDWESQANIVNGRLGRYNPKRIDYDYFDEI